MIKSNNTILLLILIITFNAYNYEWNNAISVGPMLHMNIGEDMNVSIAFEIAFWQLKNNHFPWSVNFGVEFGSNAQRVYSELQTGLVLAGISSGIAAEYRKGEFFFGYQGSIWANFFAGFDYRYRRINKENFFCPGFYVKAPIFLDSKKEISN